MKRTKLIIISVLLVVLCVANVSWAGGKFETSSEMVADAKTRIEEISVEDFKAMLDKGEEYVLIDVREPAEYAAGYISGAISSPRGLLEFKIIKAVPDRKAVIIVNCKSGGRSALAADTLESLKYKNVKSLAGGWIAWTKAYPDSIEKPEDAPEPAEKSEEPEAEEEAAADEGCE